MGGIKTRDFKIKTLGVPYRLFFKFLKKWEYKSFGWKCTDSYEKTTSDGYSTTGSWNGDTYTSTTRENFTTTKYVQFARPYAYNKYPFPNIIFSLLEVIFWLVNLLKRIFWALLIPAIIAMIALSVLGAGEVIIGIVGFAILAFPAVFVIFDIVICPIARIVRSVFKLDEKIDDFFDENGYTTWSDQDEYE